MENKLLSNIDYLIVQPQKIFHINSLILSNKSFYFRRFFRWASGKGGAHAPNAPLEYAPGPMGHKKGCCEFVGGPCKKCV